MQQIFMQRLSPLQRRSGDSKHVLNLAPLPRWGPLSERAWIQARSSNRKHPPSFPAQTHAGVGAGAGPIGGSVAGVFSGVFLPAGGLPSTFGMLGTMGERISPNWR